MTALVLLAALLIHSDARGAPDAPGAAEPAWDYAVLPIAFYAPETSLALGAGSFIFEDRAPSGPGPRRDDSLALVAIGTLNQQFVVAVEGTKYLDQDRFRLGVELVASHFPNRFWGLGNDTPDSFDRFTPSRAAATLGLGLRVFEELYLGLATSGGFFATSGYAEDGMVADYFADHRPRGHMLGGGPFLSRDTRDDAMNPRSGSLTAINALFFRRGLGSSHGYQRLDLDQRWYLPTGARGVLALQAYGELLNGDVPLNELPALGGSARLRGFYEGRYRDRIYLMTQAEWRVPVVWRLALAPFAAAGDVFPELASVSAQRVKLAGGLGLRVNLKQERALNLRIDLAVASNSTGVYVNLGEAF